MERVACQRATHVNAQPVGRLWAVLVLDYGIVGGGNEIVLVVGFRGGDSRAPKGINGSSLRRRLSFAQRLSSKKSLGKSVQFLETPAGGHRLVFVKR